MSSLLVLSVRKAHPSLVRELPLRLSYEERHSYKMCPHRHCAVSSFSCLQCSHYELFSQLTALVTKSSGRCIFPRLAPIESRKITSHFYEQVTGVSTASTSLKKRKKVKGGLFLKKDFAVSLLSKGKDKQAVLSTLFEQFPNLSKAYATTLFYMAKKEFKEREDKRAKAKESRSDN